MTQDCLAPAVPRFRTHIVALAEFGEQFAAIGPDDPPAPRWNQDWFPRLDAAMAYAMVRRRRPRRIVEIGAGHSTRFMARAVADGGLDTEIVSVDPSPRAPVDTLACVRPVRSPLQEVAAEVAGAVAGADLLFVDSSHVLAPGSDVDIVFGELLPALPADTLVHFHDIFLPGGYPKDWSARRYNEQEAVELLLTAGGWEVEFAAHYAATRLVDTVASSVVAVLPLIDGAVESSFWLRKLG